MGAAAGVLRMRRARAAYCKVDSVSAASAASALTHATITVWELPPSESCRGHINTLSVNSTISCAELGLVHR